MCWWLVYWRLSARPATQNARRDINSFSLIRNRCVCETRTSIARSCSIGRFQGYSHVSVEPACRQRRLPLILDTRNLRIEKVEVEGNRTPYSATNLSWAAAIRFWAPASYLDDARRGQGQERDSTSRRRPPCSGSNTGADRPARKRPFLFTQSQAIHARSWIPPAGTRRVCA